MLNPARQKRGDRPVPARMQALTFAVASSPKTLNGVSDVATPMEAFAMQQQISVITLGVSDLARSREFYVDGFGWAPVFQNDEIVFYQMNGLVLCTWLTSALEEDMRRVGLTRPGAFAMAHNVATQEQVQSLLDRLVSSGGRLLREADAPVHGGFRGYVADPDDHSWEIAWNPAWSIDGAGHVTFAL